MSHSKTAALLAALTLVAGLITAAPALARPQAASGKAPAPPPAWVVRSRAPLAGSPLGRALGRLALALVQPVEPDRAALDIRLGRGPYIDPNGLR